MKISRVVSHSVASIIAIIVLTLSLDLFVTQSARAGTVINNLDNGSGSLRFVVANSADNAVITFDPSVTGTILLTNGQIEISHNVTIQGPGPKTLAVDGVATYRIFHVNPGLTNVNISGLTLTHGSVVSSTVAAGGAVYNEGVLNFKNCRLTDNYARGWDGVGGSACGGAIYSTNTTGVGSLGLINCTVDRNSASGGSGSPGGAGFGAGIYIPSGYLGLTNCTFAFNNAYGGNGTGSGDGGNAGGGAIYSLDLGDLINCTIRLNGAFPGGSALGSPGSAFGGGVITRITPPYTRVLNTILTDNSGGASRDGYGVFDSLGHNLHGNVGAWIDFGDFTTVVADNGATIVTPGIGPLADNGGDTPTFAISQSSPMHDMGDDAVLTTPYGLTTDQRGGFRLVDLHVDIGAYEYDRLFWFRNRVPWLVGSGRWDFSSNWGGIPCLTCDMLITNGGTKTITIDSLMSTNFLTVNNLLVSAPSNSVNTLLLSNAGLSNALTIVQNLFVQSGGALSANGSAIQVGADDCCTYGSCKTCQVYSVVFDAPATFNNSTLDASRGFEVSVGTTSTGTLGLTGSVFYANNFVVGGGGNAAGTASFVNSTSTLSHALSIASTPGSTGTLSILGGQFTATNSQSSNDFSLILDRGNAHLNVSNNATAQFGNAIIGNFGQGTVTFGAGTMTLGSTYLGMSKGSSNQFGSGLLDVLGGQITMPDLHIGVQGTGEVWMASGTLSNNTVTVGEAPGANGTLWIQGGTNRIGSLLTAGGTSNSAGVVTILGGTLDAANAQFLVGPAGSGQLILSNNPTVTVQQLKLGGTTPGSSGLLRQYGGNLKVLGLGGCEACGIFLNDGEVDGGNLDASTTSILVGINHNAAFTVTGGTVEAGNIFGGFSPGFTGTYTQSGGTVTISTNFVVGNCASNAIGHATLSNGNLYITNAAHNAALIVGDGDFTVTSGTLVVDKLIVTNSCGHFFHNGGSLTYGQLILDPNLDADGDGLSNGYELAAGSDPLSPASVRYLPGRFGVVDITPPDQSGEEDHNTEPSLAVGSGPRAVVHTFSSGSSNPLFTSSGNFLVWTQSASTFDWDATLDWSPGGTAYASLMPNLAQITVLSSSDPSTVTYSTIPSSTVTGPQRGVDQPWIRTATVGGVDHVYVGFNNLHATAGKSASVRFSLDGGATWQTVAIERVVPGGGQDSPAVRLAVSGDGTNVYALFQRFQTWLNVPPLGNSDVIGDVVLVRDDNSGLNSFGGLPSAAFPNNNTSGQGTLVASGVILPWSGASRPFGGSSLGAQRLGSACDVAIDPRDPRRVYVAYTDMEPADIATLPCIRLMVSVDGGNTFALAHTFRYASLPSLAVVGDGTVGVLYAAHPDTDLEVHFFKAYGGDFNNNDDRTLARFPNNNPLNSSDPYLGDYFQLRAVGDDFYGTFSASNIPLPEHFPSGVYYQRNVKIAGVVQNNSWLKAAGTLVDASGNPVETSIDPFFFYDIAPWWWRTPRISLFAPSASRTADPLWASSHIVWPVAPSNALPIQLETSSSLGNGAHWTVVTNVLQTNGVNEAPVSLLQPQQFFRLSQNAGGSQFQLIASADANGSISPNGVMSRSAFQTQTFTATPSNNYAVASWYVDGVAVSSNLPTVTISNITADHTIVATFAATNDIAVSVFALGGGEGPILVTNEFLYEVKVANIGLGPVTGVSMTNTLPPGVSFVSATNTQGSVAHAGSLVTANLGTLNPGATATIWISVLPAAEGEISNVVSVACNQFEPNVANNTATDIRLVFSPIVITAQPQSQTVTNGGAVTFSVAASGGFSKAALYCQWMFNDTIIPGATHDTLTLTGVTPSQAGAYSVNVYLAAGQEDIIDADSNQATLTVH
jgi:uncharacterized repeat protein (TIGR01451 family)